MDSPSLELFAAHRVVLLAAGIGTRPPLALSEGRIARARWHGELVTLEPTGVVLVRAGARVTVADLFRAWGQPPSTRRTASFTTSGRARVEVFVDGRRRGGPPGGVALRRQSEIVPEVGPHVPAHASYRFAPGS